MQATLFCHLVLFVLVTLATRTYQCSCNNTEIDGAAWGSWVGEGICSGQCNDAVLERTRQCHVQGGVGTTPRVENCSISSKSDCGECLGEWSVWSSSGGCSTACGMGIQKRSRTCYMNYLELNIRTSQCRGSNGEEEQFKNETCYRRGDICNNNSNRSPRTKPSLLPTTTVTTTTATTTSTTASSTTSIYKVLLTKAGTKTTQGTIAENSGTSGKESDKSVGEIILLQPNDTPTKKVSGGIDTVTLAAVLGSLTIICITVVAISATVVYVKKQELIKSAMISPTLSNNSFVKPGPQSLPNSNSYHSLAYINAIRSLPPPHVSNPLYQASNASDEDQNYESFESTTQDHQQRDSSATVYEIDPIYFSVDDIKR